MILIKGTKIGSTIEQLFDTMENGKKKIEELENMGYIVSITMKNNYEKELLNDLNNLFEEEVENDYKKLYN